MTDPASSPVDALLEVMARLRDPDNGCPWDREQTYATIVPHTIEEAYEVADAIAREDWPELQAELGDLLFQVVFYAQIAREEGRFDFDDVANGIVEKMTRRHPHVFSDARYANAAEQTAAWERIKAAEKPERPAGVLDGIPLALPALTRAVKLQKKAARVGFDWGAVEPVLAKIEEEIAKLEPGDAKEFLECLGLKESGLDRLIRGAFRLLDLITYITTGEIETRAWTIQKGTGAAEAAGKIHSDLEKGFIRAEVVTYEDMVKYRGRVGAKEAGKARSEGREYVVEDGDVVLFFHN